MHRDALCFPVDTAIAILVMVGQIVGARSRGSHVKGISLHIDTAISSSGRTSLVQNEVGLVFTNIRNRAEIHHWQGQHRHLIGCRIDAVVLILIGIGNGVSSCRYQGREENIIADPGTTVCSSGRGTSG